MPDARDGVTLDQITAFGLATLIARAGRFAELDLLVRQQFSLELPQSPRFVRGEALSFIGCGPHHWLALSTQLRDGALAADLSQRFGALAAVADQSSARALFRIKGRSARDLLARCVPIDLHPRAFQPGDAASTIAHHISVQLLQVDEAPTFELLVPQSFADSLWHWIHDLVGVTPELVG